MSRAATHAGSWYSSNHVGGFSPASKLSADLTAWLHPQDEPDADSNAPPDLTYPLKGLQAVIAPHAGYAYSGPPAGWAFRCIDPTSYDRVFILGPSHHQYIDGCALSTCQVYQTPLGDLPLDLTTIEQLRASRMFTDMTLETDEDEHSIEMELPYIRKVFEGQNIKIVPILVGAINQSKETVFGDLLAPYLNDPRTLFVVSSDFCHWGSRFSYTYYKPSDTADATSLGRSTRQPTGQDIHQSIRALDRRGIDALTVPLSAQGDLPTYRIRQAEFGAYLKETRNTICGRHPIGVLVAAAAQLQDANTPRWGPGETDLQFVRYEQSSQAVQGSDSSVSYASAYLRAGV